MYEVIYNVIDEVKAATGMLEPQEREACSAGGSAIFKVASARSPRIRTARTRDSRVARDSVVIYDGKLGRSNASRTTREVAAGYECGLSVENFNDLKEGDVNEAYMMEQFAAVGV